MTAPRPTHPGVPTQPRRLALAATNVRHHEVRIAAGDELFAFADRLARGFAGSAALLQFDAVPMRRVAVHVPEPDPTRRQIMRYGSASVFDAPCTLVGAQMSIGIDGDAPVLHCHGHLRTADGRAYGGHLSPGGCIVAEAATVRCSVFDGVRLEPTFDTETGFSLLSPARSHDAAPSAETTRRSGVQPPTGSALRLKPDEDLVDAITAFARDAGAGAGALRVVGGVGSLMRATLAAPDGSVTAVDGPGVEIVTLDGTAGALRMVVADLAGGVHAGEPVAGGNPICVTIELFVEASS